MRTLRILGMIALTATCLTLPAVWHDKTKTVSGDISTFAGGAANPQSPRGYSGDGGPALGALLCDPASIDQDSSGNLFIADQCSDRIRQISAFPGYGLSTGSLTFQPKKVGTASASQTITVSPIGPTKIAILNISHGFQETDNCANTQLTTGQTCSATRTPSPSPAPDTTNRGHPARRQPMPAPPPPQFVRCGRFCMPCR